MKERSREEVRIKETKRKMETRGGRERGKEGGRREDKDNVYYMLQEGLLL